MSEKLHYSEDTRLSQGFGSDKWEVLLTVPGILLELCHDIGRKSMSTQFCIIIEVPEDAAMFRCN